MRSFNWLENTARSLAVRYSSMAPCSEYITRRLSALLLERLPREEALEMLELLPPIPAEERAELQASARTDRDASIGYPDFVERAVFAIGTTSLLGSGDPGYEDGIRALAKSMADAYLWTVGHEIPTDLKYRIGRALPPDLRSRMDLYTTIDENKVA